MCGNYDNKSNNEDATAFFCVALVQLLGGERGAPAYGKDSLAAPRNTSGYFEAPAPLHGAAETPMKQREHRMSYSPRASLALEAPSPMPTWGGGNNKGGAMSLRDASYGEALEVGYFTYFTAGIDFLPP